MDIARIVVATSPDRRKLDKMPPSNVTSVVLMDEVSQRRTPP
jgi:hypothetical protein